MELSFKFNWIVFSLLLHILFFSVKKGVNVLFFSIKDFVFFQINFTFLIYACLMFVRTFVTVCLQRRTSGAAILFYLAIIIFLSLELFYYYRITILFQCRKYYIPQS